MTPLDRRPSGFDRLARLVALLALVVILTAIYWIPLILLNTPFTAPLLLALLTLGIVNLSSRLYRLRQRIDGIEARLSPPVETPLPPAAEASEVPAQK